MPANTAITVEPIALTPKTISYDPTELKQIVNQHDHRYKVLPIEAIKTIRKLRLNHKRRRHLYTLQKRIQHKQHKSNTEFLINVKMTGKYFNTRAIIGTCNIQSLRNKDLQVSDLLTDYSIDILALTETWLTDNPSESDGYSQHLSTGIYIIF